MLGRNRDNMMEIGKRGGGPVKLKRTMTTSQKIGMVVKWVGLALLIVWLVWSQNKVILTSDYLYIDSSVPKTFVGYKIVNVSDLHNSSLNVVSSVKSQDPDIIIVSGGLTDSDGNYDNSVKTLAKLGQIAPVFGCYGDNDEALRDAQALDNTIENVYFGEYSIDIANDTFDIDEYLDKYLGDRVLNAASAKDEQAESYLNYTVAKISSEQSPADGEEACVIRVISQNTSEKNNTQIVDTAYDLSGTNSANVFVINVLDDLKHFEETSKVTTVDVTFSNGTHGFSKIHEGYKNGVYSENGTTLFLSRGIGNLEGYPTRIMNYPEVMVITLSDGTIGHTNPVEVVLAKLTNNVEMKFSEDVGWKEYKSEKSILDHEGS